MVGQDDLRPALTGVGVDVVLHALAVVAYQGRPGALGRVETMLVIAPEPDVRTPAGEEVLALFDVSLERLSAFLVGTDALAEGAEVVLIAAGDLGVKLFMALALLPPYRLLVTRLAGRN